MTDAPRLIENAFPLKQASLDSVHEKNVRHGHISTLHIWPARRPLAACRAALIATLLPDPGTPEGRKKLCERIGGTIGKRIEKKKIGGKTIEVEREETIGGILHWGRESGPDLEWFRQEIRKAYGGRAPRVLDPFAGGGAIPLEAMRLGCEATAIDINPVAWFILKCTLEYPQKLAGERRPLPKFALESRELMREILKATGSKTKRQLDATLTALDARMYPMPDVGLASHVRAWGWWVLQKAKADLEKFYPTIDGKPTVAYLWARTVKCKNCRAEIPLLKTRWLCKNDKKRVLLTMEPAFAEASASAEAPADRSAGKPNARKTGVRFGVKSRVPSAGGNAAQKREHDRRLGQGTMSASGAACPCCGAISTMQDLRLEGQKSRLGEVLTSTVVDGENGKEFRLPTELEISASRVQPERIRAIYRDLPQGPLKELIPNNPRRFATPLYGMMTFESLFVPRQKLALGVFARTVRSVPQEMRRMGYSDEWTEAVLAHLALAHDRLADYSSGVCTWHNSREKMRNTFGRWALPFVWDYCEVNPISNTSGNFFGAIDWVARVCETLVNLNTAPTARVIRASATDPPDGKYDLVVTDPPYYDAIPYSDVSNFFYVWLRRVIGDRFPEHFSTPLVPYTGELVMDRLHQSLAEPRTRKDYETGMSGAFAQIHRALAENGRFVVVFAHKEPNAWETLVSAIIRTGFIVDGSWPIQTEMANRSNAIGTAALASSVWLVCKKRTEATKPGWDNAVLEEMRTNIHKRLVQYWDAGIRGPDFVWAATGPALEAYSKYPVVKKANEPGKTLEVAEFLRAVRRIVVDFVVGRVLTKTGDETAVSGLDDVTTYYLLHRHDFGMDDAPAGACILYAVSCGLKDADLADQYDVLVRTGGKEEDAEESEEGEEIEEGTGSEVRLKPWNQRKSRNLGYDSDGKPAPLVDQVHRLMHLWKAGDVAKVDEYVESRALGKNPLFHRLLQALIELAGEGSDERALLESISNHVGKRGITRKLQKELPGTQVPAEAESE